MNNQLDHSNCIVLLVLVHGQKGRRNVLHAAAAEPGQLIPKWKWKCDGGTRPRLGDKQATN